MNPAETYDELLASPDLEQEVKSLSDGELREVRAWLARGEATGWVAERVHGVCILDACRRFEEATAPNGSMLDVDHGSEVPQ